ncbi:hypothetical protein VRU48_05240 [Pedobacter sp. KR3-3]|uniref:Uncharacterized protein n=1 Tax=Pedobacter albus TaxID=3113905 RepID=A0ABU7I4X3_9SPHI|nr:hypothetical protein [Pedobacter sp. KR3-3]MEE1944502.1 hypothetical protein [Pedobacter sp. KR3-3]
MNSYNENLYATVVSSLRELDQKQKSAKSSLNAAMFTLYYKEAGRITAESKLKEAGDVYLFQQKVKQQAVNDRNVSFNVLNAANQQKKFTAQAITNAATSAANIQVLSNAVAKLSKNVGGILTMLTSSDYGSEIYKQSRIAYDLMIDTAYDAKKLSQLGREVSTLTAAVSADEVANQAKLTDDSIASILAVTTSDFEATAKSLADCNEALATANVVEKQAEGDLEFINVDYFATRRAYNLNNKVLNLNLVSVALNSSDFDDDKKDNCSYVVRFNPYQPPFDQALTMLSNKPKNSSVVEDYYIMLVKESSQATFSITAAETLLLTADPTKKCYYRVEDKSDDKPMEHIFYTASLRDTDGNSIEVGTKYVAFVLVVLTDEYKKTINSYSDILSAPSVAFMLSNKLMAPKAVTCVENVLTFELLEKASYNVEYRCMFLPNCIVGNKNMLTESGLRNIEKEVELQEKMSAVYAPAIADLQKQIVSLNNSLDGLREEKSTNDAQLALAKKDKNKENQDSSSAKNTELQTQIDAILKEIEEAERKLRNNKVNQNRLQRAMEEKIQEQPGFFFNLMIAEQITSANYSQVVPQKTVDSKDKKEKGDSAAALVKGKMEIHENTTDNFGNPLVKGASYIPVVLAYANMEDQNGQFTNALSAFETTSPFIYTPKTKTK